MTDTEFHGRPEDDRTRETALNSVWDAIDAMPSTIRPPSVRPPLTDEEIEARKVAEARLAIPLWQSYGFTREEWLRQFED